MSDRIVVAWTVVLAGILSGCSGSPNQAPPASGTGSGPVTPGTTGPGEVGTTGMAPAALTFKVLQENAASGVAAEIDRIDDTGASHYVVDVDDSGVAQLKQPCAATDRFSAQPKVPAYLRVSPQPCGRVVTFRLYSAQATFAMLQIADTASKNGDLEKAQAYYGLASDRLKYEHPQEASQVQTLANVAAGRLLGVDAQKTTEFGDKLRAFQRASNLPVTGVLDTGTQEKLSDVSFAQLSREIDTDPSKVGNSSPLRSQTSEEQLRSVALSPAATARSNEIRRTISVR